MLFLLRITWDTHGSKIQSYSMLDQVVHSYHCLLVLMDHKCKIRNFFPEERLIRIQLQSKTNVGYVFETHFTLRSRAPGCKLLCQVLISTRNVRNSCFQIQNVLQGKANHISVQWVVASDFIRFTAGSHKLIVLVTWSLVPSRS